jgi:hypothetical protein
MKNPLEKVLVVFLAIVGARKILGMVNQVISLFLLIVFFAIMMLILMNS